MEHEVRGTGWAPTESLPETESYGSLLLPTSGAGFPFWRIACTVQAAGSELYETQHNTPTLWTGWHCKPLLPQTDPGDAPKARDCNEAGLALTWGSPNAKPDIYEANPKRLARLAQMFAE